MQLSRERDDETGAVVDDADTGESSDGGRLTGVRRRVGRVFAIRGFLLALGVVGAGAVAGGTVGGFIPFLGTVGQVVGVFAATFLLGTLRSHRQYLEVGLAGALLAALLAVTSLVNGVFLPIGVEWLQQYGIALGAIGAGTGAVASLLGYYFGRDLRDGLTKSI